MIVSTDDVEVGEAVDVAVHVSGTSGLAHAPFHLRFDSRVVRFEDADEGPFLGSDGGATVFIANADTSGEAIVVGLSRLGRIGGVGGDGTLCRFRFTAIAPGNAGFAFVRARLADSGNRVMPSTFEPARVTVR